MKINSIPSEKKPASVHQKNGRKSCEKIDIERFLTCFVMLLTVCFVDGNKKSINVKEFIEKLLIEIERNV